MIGLDCPSGDFDDCKSDWNYEDIPEQCRNFTIISAVNKGTCGSRCLPDENYSKKRRSDKNKVIGWTIYKSEDSPDNTGDHENYFSEGKNYIFESTGDKFSKDKCKVIASRYRQKTVQTFWTSLDAFFMFSTKPTTNQPRRKYSYEMINDGG